MVEMTRTKKPRRQSTKKRREMKRRARLFAEKCTVNSVTVSERRSAIQIPTPIVQMPEKPATFYKQAKNFCLFYAALNSLGTEKEQRAFRGIKKGYEGRADAPPHALFEEVTHTPGENDTRSREEIAAEKDRWGYTFEDMEAYLIHLVMSELISTHFVWKPVRSRKAYASVLLPLGGHSTLIAFAEGSTHPDIRRKTTAALKKAALQNKTVAPRTRRQRMHSVTQMINTWQQRKELLGKSGYAWKDFTSHAVGFGWRRRNPEGPEALMLFDGGRNSIVEAGTRLELRPESIIPSAIVVQKFHVFQITLL